MQSYNKALNMSQLQVQVNASSFCIEPIPVNTSQRGSPLYCPPWAGGTPDSDNATLNTGWISLNISVASASTIAVDLTPLNGMQPTSVRYAWGVLSCCDPTDKLLYVTHPCGPAPCPVMSSSGLPANPFISRIVNGNCVCVPPQVC